MIKKSVSNFASKAIRNTQQVTGGRGSNNGRAHPPTSNDQGRNNTNRPGDEGR
jgi:hypothetical protein